MTHAQLTFLVYLSRIGCPPDGIDDIVRTSVVRNAASKVTGALMHDATHFLQFLEGPSTATASTILRIMSDARHDEVTILVCEPTQTRLFSNWQMKHVSLRDRGATLARQMAKLAAEPRPARSLLLQRLALDMGPGAPVP
ncbi:MAG: BLUF domain-containing protein [Rhodobacteraceae bacterium]|nr:BLUF domain-containing protein [Paracoccaceae bacterium]